MPLSLVTLSAKDSARRTIHELIGAHEAALMQMRSGMHYFRHGEDITVALYKRVEFEIEQCRMVLEAIDNMKDGDVQRAAALCEQVKEHILNVQ